ncbi:reverse transcriptase domain-containing protein, partial [Tanacetum coccineum]
LQKVMRNNDGVFMFKFASKEGLDQVLQRGPWMIRMSPIILNKCSSGLSLKKGEVTRVSSRISFACALIEVSSESGLKSKVTMAIPNEEGDGYTKEVIRVEYEWKPPHCGDCKIFGHDLLQCPKHVKEIVFNDPSKVGTSTSTDTSSDGFTEVTRKKNKGAQAHQKLRSRHIDGIRLNKPKPNFYWQKKGTNKSGANLSCKGQMGTNSSNNKGNGPSTSISFEVLNKVDVGDECGISSSMGTANEHTRSTWNEDFEFDDEVDEVIFSKSNKWDDHFDIRLKGRVRK